MPSVPIYIRQADYERWLAIKDKSQFISDCINRRPTGGFSEEPVLVAQTPLTTTVPYAAGLVLGADFVPKPPDTETGYPCCLGKRPCKHWQWDGNKSAYINSLTGKEREVAL